MKSDDFQRSARSSHGDRSTGDAPDLGRVARMPGTGLPKGERRKRRRSEGGKSSRIRQARKLSVWIWTGMTLGAAVLVLAGVIIVWLVKVKRGGEAEIAARPVVEELPAPQSVVPEPTEREATGLVREALAAQDLATVQSHFHLGKSEPGQALDFLRDMEKTDGPITRYQHLGPLEAGGLQISGVLVFSEKSGKVRNRIAMLRPDANGAWQVDFGAFARAVSPAWPEILKPETKTATVRVYAAKDNYFNGPFAEEAVWDSYGLASPDTKSILNAYCRKDSAQARALDSICKADAQLNRVILEIRRTEGALPLQFEITAVLAEDWAMPDTHFDKGFE